MPKTALYERLSADDDLPGESLSIRNQREYLEHYAAQHGFIPYTHYADDGYSGTTFQRPAFRKMLQAIEKGEIDTVIVRDLSRFGRNYREAGFYLEKHFPTYHVRFIAVLNQVDTGKNSDDFTVPLFNVINDWYSRDLSRRKKNSYRHRNRTGQRTYTVPMYGFLCDPQDRNNWQIDEPAAAVVRKIYRWFLQGYTMEEVANRLNTEGALTPNDYYLVRGWTSRHSWRHQTSHDWTDRNLQRMLKDEEYKGTMVLGKNTERHTFDDTHAAIISPDNWEILQKRLKILQPSHMASFDDVPNFPPIFQCSSCHQRLYTDARGTEPILRCRNPQCNIGRTIPGPIVIDVCRILRDTLWNSIPDKPRLQRQARRIRQQNKSRRETTLREFTAFLEERLLTVSQQMIRLYEEDMDPEMRVRLLEAYHDERELIQRALTPPLPEEERPLSSAFLTCIYAFVDRIEISAKSRNTQCVLIHLSTNIPQPPPRQLKLYQTTYTIHFIPSNSKTPSDLLLQLLQDDLL